MSDPTPPVVEEQRGGLFSNLVAIVGLIVLVVIVIWGLIHLVGLSQGWFSSLFPSGSKVTVTAPKEVVSGESFNVSWKYSGTDKGNYAIVYQCKEGLSVKNAAGSQLPCGSAYTVGPSQSISLVSTLQSGATSTLPISIVFFPSATSSPRIQGTATVLVHAESANTTANNGTATTPAANTHENPAPQQPSTKGQNQKPAAVTHTGTPADLAVRLVAFGVINRSTGMFEQRSPTYADDIAAAQFDIANVGGSSSGTYYFSANLPTVNGYIYNSPPQSSLAPGDHVLNTLRWTESTGGTFTITVTGDSNTANNFAQVTLVGPPAYNYAPNTYYAQPTYPQYTY